MTLRGGVLGLSILPNMSGAWLDALLAHVGSGFIFLVSHAVFGESIKQGKKLVLLSFAASMGLIATFTLVVWLLGKDFNGNAQRS